MQIFTSRYRNSRAIQACPAIPVRTSVGAPNTPYHYESAVELAPVKSWIGLSIDRYEPLYLAKIEALGVVFIRELLDEVGGGRDVILLCYENLMKPDEWCHRQMFARWWESQTGQKVLELPDRYQPRPAKQHSLFDGGFEFRVSKAVREKATRLIQEGKVKRTATGWEVRGDTGTHQVKAVGPALLPEECSCPTSPGYICSHRLAAYMLDPTASDGV